CSHDRDPCPIFMQFLKRGPKSFETERFSEARDAVLPFARPAEWANGTCVEQGPIKVDQQSFHCQRSSERGCPLSGSNRDRQSHISRTRSAKSECSTPRSRI